MFIWILISSFLLSDAVHSCICLLLMEKPILPYCQSSIQLERENLKIVGVYTCRYSELGLKIPNMRCRYE